MTDLNIRTVTFALNHTIIIYESYQSYDLNMYDSYYYDLCRKQMVNNRKKYKQYLSKLFNVKRIRKLINMRIKKSIKMNKKYKYINNNDVIFV